MSSLAYAGDVPADTSQPAPAKSRRHSLTGALARHGFIDTARAAATFSALGVNPEEQQSLLNATGAAADPDAALAGFADLNQAARASLLEDPAGLLRALAVIGGSKALGRHLVTRVNAGCGPDDWSHTGPKVPRAVAAGETGRVLDYLRGGQPLRRHDAQQLATDLWGSVMAAVGRADDLPVDGPGITCLPDPYGAGADALRRANRDQLVRIAARDLTSPDPASELPGIAGELSDLADVVTAVALALVRGQVPDEHLVRLAVIALGKCGARELNYISDVDVLFVAEPVDPATTSPTDALRIATQMAAALARLTSTGTSAGSIWTLDAALRPEGNAGPLVRTMRGMQVYYERHAATWEFQAMMKARPLAGDFQLGRQFCDMVAPLVWGAGGKDGFVVASRAMRRRVVSMIPPELAERDIKLGAGGLRDVEFTAQILQLVHGRADEQLRCPSTLEALATLSSHGYMGREDAAALDEAYRFERLLEHRQQLFRLRRTHLMPEDAAGLRRLARSLPEATTGADLWARWRQTAALVQRLQQRVFYSPLLEAVSKVPSGALRLSSTSAAERLAALGFADPAGALRHIGALTQGVSRAAEITRHIMPAMLGWLAEGANPDAGLLAFRQVSEALGRSPWYLKALRDESGTAERLAHVMASSRFCVDLLRRDPPSVGLLRAERAELGPREGGDLAPRDAAELAATFAATVGRHTQTSEAVQALRAVRRHELARLAIAVALGRMDVEATGAAVSDVTAATLDAALALVARVFPNAPPLGVIAMGRWGGHELGFASDADVMFVAPDDTTDAGLASAGEAVAALRSWLAGPGPDPGLDVDVRLRPEGQDGPLVRTVSSYLAYYGRWSWTWEAQALVRAAHGAGDAGLTGGLLDGIAGLRWPVRADALPTGGLSAEDVRAIQALKVRLERERGGAGRAANLKLSPGGLIDIEWSVQLLQLCHAGTTPSLRVTGTLAALRAGAAADLISPGDAATLIDSWRLVSAVRDAIMLARGRAADTVPSDPRDMAAVAMLLQYNRADALTLVEDLAKAMRQASRVADKLFWGRA